MSPMWIRTWIDQIEIGLDTGRAECSTFDRITKVAPVKESVKQEKKIKAEIRGLVKKAFGQWWHA